MKKVKKAAKAAAKAKAEEEELARQEAARLEIEVGLKKAKEQAEKKDYQVTKSEDYEVGGDDVTSALAKAAARKRAEELESQDEERKKRDAKLDGHEANEEWAALDLENQEDIQHQQQQLHKIQSDAKKALQDAAQKRVELDDMEEGADDIALAQAKAAARKRVEELEAVSANTSSLKDKDKKKKKKR